MIDDISVLIAEDETQLREFMAEYLQLIFKNVHTAADGMEAWRLYERRRPDIILADIHMPRLDGLSLIEKIREHDRRTRIIILSAHSEKEKLLQAIGLQLVKYLIKPVASDTLKTLLLDVVDEIRRENGHLPLGEKCHWNLRTRILTCDGGEVALKPKERKALARLCEHAGQTVSPYDLHNAMYDDDPDREYSYHAVTSTIKRLRAKLPPDTITTLYGSGYLLRKKS